MIPPCCVYTGIAPVGIELCPYVNVCPPVQRLGRAKHDYIKPDPADVPRPCFPIRQVSKGRDTGVSQVTGFTAKISMGNGMQVH